MDIYKPIRAVIKDVITETSNIKTFLLKPDEEFKFLAGQFIELTIPGFSEAPFTPSSSPYEPDKLEVTIMKAGSSTAVLHRMKKGDVVGIRGPLGLGYPKEELYKKEILIIGGGVGAAPLRSLFLSLVYEIQKFKKITFCYGAKTPEDIVYKDQIPEWMKIKNVEMKLSVDIGNQDWKHNVGVVTTLLDGMKFSGIEVAAIVCGPPVMMKFSTLKLLDIGVPADSIYLSMEKNMSCGVGKCGHCITGKYYVCKDGPVFKWSLIKDIPEVFD